MILTSKPSIFSRLEVNCVRAFSDSRVCGCGPMTVRATEGSFVQKVQAEGRSCAAISQLGTSRVLRYPQPDVANPEADRDLWRKGWDVVAYVALIIPIA